jgi:hypothetical protein
MQDLQQYPTLSIEPVVFQKNLLYDGDQVYTWHSAI